MYIINKYNKHQNEQWDNRLLDRQLISKMQISPPYFVFFLVYECINKINIIINISIWPAFLKNNGAKPARRAGSLSTTKPAAVHAAAPPANIPYRPYTEISLLLSSLPSAYIQFCADATFNEFPGIWTKL